MGVIDADAHVIETEQTWSFMREEDRRFAPELLVSTKNGVEYWRIDERVYANSNLGLNVPIHRFFYGRSQRGQKRS